MKETKLKLISTDFDGTLFAEFERPPISPEVIGLIARLQSRGAKWVINTGRDMSSLMESLARAVIPIQPDYLVIVEREIYKHDGVRYVGDAVWNSACAADHQELFEEVRPAIPPFVDWVNANFQATVYEDEHSPFCLIAGNCRDAETIHNRLNDFIAKFPDLTVVRNDVYARLSHANYNKGTALGEIARQLEVSPEETFAAGDHMNDFPMLQRQFAHSLAAPANAIPEIKKLMRDQGGFISERECGAGIADGLRHFLNGEAL